MSIRNFLRNVRHPRFHSRSFRATRRLFRRLSVERLEDRRLLAAIAPPTDLVAWWDGDGSANDIQGPTFENGALQNGATFAAGVVGQAFSFDGVDDYVDVGNPPDLNLTGNEITVQGWVMETGSTGHYRTVISKGYVGAPFALRMARDQASSPTNFGLFFQVATYNGTVNTGVMIPQAELDPNVWYHVAGTYDGANVKLYINGNLIDQQALTGNLLVNNEPVTIGRNQAPSPNTGEFWRGRVDELAVSNRALDATEIQAVYNAGSDGMIKPGTNQPPTITSATTVVIDENQTTVIDFQSTDPDGETENGGGLTYSLTGGADKNLFSINTATGVLTFNAAPDYENPTDMGDNNVYDVQVTVTDAGGLTDMQDIAVTVAPVNDNAPVFTSATTANVAENTTAVQTLAATDADLPSSPAGAGFVTFSYRTWDPDRVLTGTFGYDTSVLDTDLYSGTGDYPNAGFWTGTIVGGPQGGHSFAFNNLFVFLEHQVGSSDRIQLRFFADAHDSSLHSVLTLLDNTGVLLDSANQLPLPASLDFSNYVGIPYIKDGDLWDVEGIPNLISGYNNFEITGYSFMPTQTVSFSIIGGADASKFEITAGNQLKFKVAPDFENPSDADTNNVYELQVKADDQNGLSTLQTVSVTVTPVNDNAPVFTSATTANVAENTTAVIDVEATDSDGETENGGGLTYSLTGGADKNLFSINANTGVLTFNAAPDFENATDVGGNNVYDVQVTVTDAGGLTDVQDIAVTVTPVNDNAPAFTSATTANVAENTTAVLTLSATDADLPAQTVIFSIVGGADQAKFTLTGGNQLAFIAAPDFETPTDVGANNVYEVQIKADDQNGLSTLQMLTITVTPVNDNAPVFTSATTANVAENTTAVRTLAATDADLPSQTVVFSIVGGADQAKFTLMGGNQLAFIAAPDFENPTDSDANNVYELQVKADDQNGLTTTQTLTITVTPVNDNAPVFTSATTANVAENTTAVQSLSATDADLPSQTAAFSIVGGADHAKFTITGGNQLAFISAPDFETPLDADADNVYEVEIEADDDNGLTTTQTVFVTVLNQASITGTVFIDANTNNQFDANEAGIDGVLIELLDATGSPVLDDFGNAITTFTSDGGFYLFEDLDPGVYRIFENQPTGVGDGLESLGSLGGSIVANDTMELTLNRTDASDYVFAELGQQLTSGDTAGAGFWHNKHGQALIAQGGSALADWLTDNFGNVFGNALVGASGNDVAAFYKNQLFKQKGKKSAAGPAKVDAHFMAVAFATFFTSSDLAGAVATDYGFNVTQIGICMKLVNVGSASAAFGATNGSNLTIMQLLQATNNLTDQTDEVAGFAYIYDADGDGVIDADEATLRAMANDIYSAINENGSI